MIKIRLSKTGKKKEYSYKIVVSDSRFPRDGKFIEKIGFIIIFNKNNIKFELNNERFNYWLNNGSKVSKRIKFLIKKYKNNI